MPHYKCSPCRIRLHQSIAPADEVGDLCPQCGALLEPVAHLAELFGFRPLTAVDYQRDPSAPTTTDDPAPIAVALALPTLPANLGPGARHHG